MLQRNAVLFGVTLLLAGLCLSVILVAGEQEAKKESPANGRYSVQAMSVGGIAFVYNITDHQEMKLYCYTMKKDNLVLDSTADLTKTGQVVIPLEKNDKGEE